MNESTSLCSVFNVYFFLSIIPRGVNSSRSITLTLWTKPIIPTPAIGHVCWRTLAILLIVLLRFFYKYNFGIIIPTKVYLISYSKEWIYICLFTSIQSFALNLIFIFISSHYFPLSFYPKGSLLKFYQRNSSLWNAFFFKWKKVTKTKCKRNNSI